MPVQWSCLSESWKEASQLARPELSLCLPQIGQRVRPFNFVALYSLYVPFACMYVYKFVKNLLVYPALVLLMSWECLYTCTCISHTQPIMYLTDSNDYERVFSEALTFSSTSLQDSVTIRITDDTTVEGLESFVATLEVNNALNPGVILNPDEAEISIRDNDGECPLHGMYQVMRSQLVARVQLSKQQRGCFTALQQPLMMDLWHTIVDWLSFSRSAMQL